jgi:peptidoglycan hydrolase CwlO-like protein
MKKIIFILSVLMGVINVAAFAQSVREGSIQYNKTSQSGLIADYNYSKEAVEAVLQKRFADAKLGKSKSSNKFNVFAEVIWGEITSDKVDVYYKVSTKKNVTTVEIMLSKGYDNFVSASNDPNATLNLKNFLMSLEPDLKAYNVGTKVKEQEEVVKKAEKAVANSNANVDKLEKQKVQLEKNIEKAKKELEDTKQALEKQTSVLNSIK